jgi:hypothetical protein
MDEVNNRTGPSSAAFPQKHKKFQHSPHRNNSQKQKSKLSLCLGAKDREQKANLLQQAFPGLE